MGKVVFITGASGWVGRHVVPEVMTHGWSVTANARSEESAKALEAQGVKVIRASLTDVDELRDAAKAADAVIHLAYIHDFSPEGQKAAHAADVANINALCSALQGTNKVFVGTSGTFAAGFGAVSESTKGAFGPRAEAEELAFTYTAKGVRPIVVRLSPTNHGDGDNGFIPMIVGVAKEKGVSAYVGSGDNHWPAVHVKDTAVLYRLAIEKDLPGGTILHAAAEPGIKWNQIAPAIAKQRGLEVKSVPKEEAQAHFGWMSMFISADAVASSDITRKLTGWEPKEKGLIQDLEEGTYFV